MRQPGEFLLIFSFTPEEKKLMKRPFFVFLSVIVLLATALSACSPAAATAPSSLIKVRVATDATYPPFESVDDKTKELVGFDIDLIKAVATKAGFDLELVNINFDALLAGMGTCQYDLAISATTITEDRKKTMLFSDPYINGGQILAVQKTNTTINSKDDLQGKKIGVQISTTGAIEAGKITGATVKTYDTVDLAFQDLANGQIDATIVDYPTSANYVAKMSDKIKNVGQVFTDESYGIVACKTKTDLIAKVNTALAALKSEGFLTQLEDKWVKAK
jgi:polar amino acid transport system substrate-binding protein